MKPQIGGLFLMPLRWVCAWVLFAAAWRRWVLKPEDLNPNSPVFEGHKLVNFLPHTFWIKAILNYIIVHPQVLLIFLWSFTILEFTVGILLFLGLMTRVLGLILIFLFVNLMLVAGWLGSTCLDEWTVSAFGIALGVCLFLAGSGPYSIDSLIIKRFPHLIKHRWFGILFSPELSFVHPYSVAKRYALILSCITLAFVLYTNQHFVGGVYGPFHNPAIGVDVKFHAELQKKGILSLTLYCSQAPETYGAFIVSVAVKNSQNQMIVNYDTQLRNLSPTQIHNHYIVKAAANGYSFVLPLGSLSTIQLLPPQPMQLAAGNYKVIVTDVSGKSWQTDVTLNGAKKIFNPYALVKK